MFYVAVVSEFGLKHSWSCTFENKPESRVTPLAAARLKTAWQAPPPRPRTLSCDRTPLLSEHYATTPTIKQYCVHPAICTDQNVWLDYGWTWQVRYGGSWRRQCICRGSPIEFDSARALPALCQQQDWCQRVPKLHVQHSKRSAFVPTVYVKKAEEALFGSAPNNLWHFCATFLGGIAQTSHVFLPLHLRSCCYYLSLSTFSNAIVLGNSSLNVSWNWRLPKINQWSESTSWYSA